MNKLAYIPLLLACSITSAYAAVPNTFKNGEVADADHVNANFTALDTAILELGDEVTDKSEALETSISDLKAELDAMGVVTEIPRTYNYERTPAKLPLGTIITIGNVEHRITELDVPGQGGLKQSIILPVPTSFSFTISSDPDFATMAREGYKSAIDGHEVSIVVHGGSSLTKDADTLTFKRTFDGVSVYVTIEKTVLRIDLNSVLFPADTELLATIDPADPDLSDDMSSSTMDKPFELEPLTVYLNHLHFPE